MAWAAAVLVLALALGWLVWASFGRAREVTAQTVGFTVVDDTRVEVTYDVTKDADTSAVCELWALDRNRLRVGTVRVTVGPTPSEVTRRSDVVRTSARAVAGVVDQCRATR